MRRTLSFVLMGCMIFSIFTIRGKANPITTAFEITVRQVAVADGVASITGLAAGATVDLYDNLGQELLDSGMTDSDGRVKFTLDDRYPMSGKSVYNTMAAVNGINNGVITCSRNQICQVDLFAVSGLRTDSNDALLIAKVVRSDNLAVPVEGIQFDVWPLDTAGIPLNLEQIPLSSSGAGEYSGEKCISDTEGYCIAYVSQSFYWVSEIRDTLATNMTVRYDKINIFDGYGIWIPDGQIRMVDLAVDGKGHLADCTFKTPPQGIELPVSCMDKIHQTATVQAQITPDIAEQNAINAAVVQASRLSHDTAELFYLHKVDKSQIDALIESSNTLGPYDPQKIKIILYVNEIINDGSLAVIGGPVIGNDVIIYEQDDPGQVLGACRTTSLGECMVRLDRSVIRTPDGLMRFRVIADGYDNGIQICENKLFCELHIFTPVDFSGKNDAIVMVKTVKEKQLLEPFQNAAIRTVGVNEKGIPRVLRLVGNNYIVGQLSKGSLGNGEFECYSNEDGFCPIYVDDLYYWSTDQTPNYGYVGIINNTYINDGLGVKVYDDRLTVINLAVDPGGSVEDCVFTSPMEQLFSLPVCLKKKNLLLTAQSLYTATPTMTITPLVSMTPTATEVPPTPITTPTSFPEADLASSSLPGWVIPTATVVVLAILGVAIWAAIFRRKK